jgi:putative transcriptional regulator
MEPALLIASPQMTDPFFERTVVLLWHHDEDGAVGVVLNRPLEQRLGDVVSVDADVDAAPYDDDVIHWGGPVETDSGTVVTRADLLSGEGWQLDCGVGVTRSQEALVRLMRSHAPIRLCLGYAGWGPGQLDQEIASGGWLLTGVDPELVMSGDGEALYERALATLGLTPHTVWMTPIDE